MMCAVHFGKTVGSALGTAQWLNITMLLLGQIMSFDVKLQCAAEGYVEDLKTFANCQNRQPACERVLDSLKLPAVALRVDLVIQHRKIWNFLAQKFRRNIRAA